MVRFEMGKKHLEDKIESLRIKKVKAASKYLSN